MSQIPLTRAQPRSRAEPDAAALDHVEPHEGYRPRSRPDVRLGSRREGQQVDSVAMPTNARPGRFRPSRTQCSRPHVGIANSA